MKTAEQLKHRREQRRRTAQKLRDLYPERNRATSRRCNQNRKIEVLSHYGKDGHLQCCWPGCLETDLDVLTLDHVNNDGAKDRIAGRATGTGLYYRVRNDGFPVGFQTLCANHQLKKEILRRREKIE